MDYQPREIEKKWKKYWEDNEVYQVSNESDRPKYYVLDMFPYPSGSGLHVGHPLGYIASDIFTRYKRLKGFNVLHPMGYDAFGLPAEQYAVQIGVHPAESTAKNIARYRQQLDNIGLCFDWDREVQTCDPDYYKWTQWIFIQLFNHYYCNDANKAQPITNLIAIFEKGGNANVNASTSQDDVFSAEEWNGMTAKQQDDVLANYRLAYRQVQYVNWCEALGTILANDEVKDGLSERGGHPVERRPGLSWSLRTTAYAERLLQGLDKVEWSEALKTQQRNWIGKSEGAKAYFQLKGHDEKIEIFTTRPDTIFGATFMVLAPEHDWVDMITTKEQRKKIDQYLDYVGSRSELQRTKEVKKITGEFTGAYAINPLTGKEIPVWVAEYVLKDYGTGAIMAVPSDDERDNNFANHFGLDIIPVVDKSDYPNADMKDKVGKMINSGFVTGMEVKDAIEAVIQKLEEDGIGSRQINYRLRDANFSRQRYWGEPFPILFDKDDVPHSVAISDLPVELPPLDDFKPTADGKAPLGKLTDWMNTPEGRREIDTMPGFAGSSWYFLRYMDPHNHKEFVSQEAVNYWQDVDLYIGGAEHAVGHLLYSRTWHKFFYDLGWVPTDEPFKKLVNQGMIGGRSNFVYRANEKFAEQYLEEQLHNVSATFERNKIIGEGENAFEVDFACDECKIAIELKSMHRLERYDDKHHEQFEAMGYIFVPVATEEIFSHFHDFAPIQKKIQRAFEGEKVHFNPNAKGTALFVSQDMITDRSAVTKLHVDVNIVHNDIMDTDAFEKSRTDFRRAVYLLNGEGQYRCSHANEKMSKSKFNVVNPDDMVEQYGADCFRMYEMFLGPIEQGKPWNTEGISGVQTFTKRFWSLFHSQDAYIVTDDVPTKDELKVVHTCIKNVNQNIERFSFNTCVSEFMKCTNELKKLKCHKKAVLQDLVVLLAPFAPFMAEELWHQLGNEGTVNDASYPSHNEEYLKEDAITYPISINGKKRTTHSFPTDASKDEIEAVALALEAIQKWTDGKTVRKVIVVPKRMVNIVVG